MKNLFYLSCLPFLICGCFTPTKDNSRFYTMRNNDCMSYVCNNLYNKKLTIVALHIDSTPSYTDCPYIVTLKHNNELFRSNIQRWGEPLSDNISIICKSVLQRELGEKFVIVSVPYAQKRGLKADYKITIRIHDLIFSEYDHVVNLQANWFLYDSQNDLVKKLGNICLKNPIKNQNYGDIVHGMQEIVENMVVKISRILLEEKPVVVTNNLRFLEKSQQSSYVHQPKYTKILEQTDKNSVATSKLVHLRANNGVYVVMSTKNGVRLFSGYLKTGEEKIIPCNEAYKVKSSNDKNLLVIEND